MAAYRWHLGGGVASSAWRNNQAYRRRGSAKMSSVASARGSEWLKAA
jgi:hypothetical protein